MYGSTATAGVSGGTLAMTGLTVGSMILLVVGVLFIAAGIVTLLKKNSSVRP